MGQALYRQYRPKSLSEIVGQEHITAALDNALKQGAISHAYLFTGPRGTGKTSIARILAYEVNGLPYDETRLPIDIIEIDAASNRRIDEIRDLRDKVHTAPTSAKYKVYIIDEAHMLTREAFNALLKTLEEPPAHVIFMLATTEAHKLPETIISRTQRYTFRPVERQKVADHLRTIAKTEKIKISDDALGLVADHGDGSFRDSISLLDQISNLGRAVEVDDVLSLLGIAPAEAIEQLKTTLFSGTPKQIADELQNLRERGYEAAHIAKQLGGVLRTQLLSGTTHSTDITELLAQLLNVPAAANSQALLEITLLDFNLRQAPSEQSQESTFDKAQVKRVNLRQSSGQESQEESPPKPAAAITTPPQTIAEPAKRAKTKQAHSSLPTPHSIDAFWPQTLKAVKQRNNTLHGVLRMAVPTMEDGGLVLRFQFPFHQRRIKEAKNLQIISEIIAQYAGQPLMISCLVDKDAHPAKVADVKVAEEEPEHNPLTAITNIFGGAEVLES
jgi:DNA polymerase-3 subunit gamma/tau